MEKAHTRSRLMRLLRHRWWDEADVRRVLPPEALARIEAQVADSERHHSGEIRVVVEAGLPLSYLWKRLPARQRALMLFGKLRVWDTEHNNGVLVYLLLAEHAIEIVADRGLARQVPAAAFESLLGPMREAFRAGRFEHGLAQTVASLDDLLRRHFPLAAGQSNPNELTDRPTLL